MRIAWLVIAVFAGRFFAAALTDPPGDGDLGWQRWLGAHIVSTLSLPQRLGDETFTASGMPWIPQEWFFSLVAYFSAATGWPAAAVICAFCAVGSLGIVAYTSVRRGAHPYATALGVALAGFALVQSYGTRAQVLAWPLLATFLMLVQSDGRIAYLAIAVAALWSNLHASVMLAPVLAGAVCAGNCLDRGWDARARRSAVITVASALATCANPLGWKIPIYAFTLFSSPFKAMIREWHTTNLGDVSFALGALPLLLCILAFGTNGSQRWRDRLFLAIFAWLMFSAARNVALFGLAVAPLAASALTTGLPYLRDRLGLVARAPLRGLAYVEAAAAIVLAGSVCFAYVQSGRTDPGRNMQPLQALAAVAALPGERNVLCADFAWCSYLLTAPRDRVFLDGRADPYPAGVWSDFAAIVRLQPAWKQTLRSRDVNVIVVSRTAPLEAALALAAEWQSVYVDRDFRVWQRVPHPARLAVRP